MTNKPKRPSWDEIYDKEEYHYGEEPNQFISKNTDKIKAGGRVLCLGSGEGRNAVFLAKQGFKVEAVDYSLTGLEKTRKLAEKHGVSLHTQQADLSHYPLERESYDAIISVFLHMPIETRKAVAKKVVAGLKQGGYFIAEYYHVDQLNYRTGGPENAAMLMTCDVIRQDFKGLDFQLLERVEKEIHEGTGHFGKGVVIDVIGRKR